MLGFALVLILFAMTAVGVTLTGIGGTVADVARVVFIVALGFAVFALAFARKRTSGFGASEFGKTPWDKTEIARWDPTRSGTAFHSENEASGSVASIRTRRRI